MRAARRVRNWLRASLSVVRTPLVNPKPVERFHRAGSNVLTLYQRVAALGPLAILEDGAHIPRTRAFCHVDSVRETTWE